MDRYDYKGAIHVHSTYSDGNGEVPEIVQAANAAGLDFVILTDHDQLEPRKHEGWHNSTLLIVGSEITPPENHLVVFGEGTLEGIGELKKRPPQEYIDAASKQNWLSFIAHPNYIGSKRFGTGSYRWTDWTVNGFTGMGVWHLIDSWLRLIDREDIDPAKAYDAFPQDLPGADPEMLRKFDAICQQRKIVAIGEVDNHKMTRKYNDREFVVFPYEMAFRSITNHLLLKERLSKDAKKARAQILEAIREGSLYISMDYENDPTEFSFFIDHLDENTYIGEEFTLDEDEAEINVILPEDADITMIRNSEPIHSERGFELVLPIDSPGVYRVEVTREGRPWIYSNPIFVKKPEA